jgi:hypothetical protein
MDGDIKKKHWNKEKCSICEHRFVCFSDNKITIEGVVTDNVDYELSKAVVFILPLCIRLGLFKHRNGWNDDQYLKYATIDTDTNWWSSYVWLKFPNELHIEWRPR